MQLVSVLKSKAERFRIIVLFFSAIVLPSFMQGQQSIEEQKIDSLELVLSQTSDIDERTNVMAEIIEVSKYRYENLAAQYARKILKANEGRPQNEKVLYAKRELAYYLQINGEIDSSMLMLYEVIDT